MIPDISSMPGYQVNEYKIILVPHETLSRHIMDIRKAFNEKFNIGNPSSSVPQVVLATFKQIHAAEDRILNRLKMIAMASHSFKVEMKDFGSYPSHTIFINVTSKLPIATLVTKIRQDAQRLMKLDNENKPHFLTDSHITVAMKLKPWQYEKAWLEYRHKHFSGRFIAGRMLLLRRKAGEFYKTIGSFDFENMPVETVQGDLFK